MRPLLKATAFTAALSASLMTPDRELRFTLQWGPHRIFRVDNFREPWSHFDF